ncbi:MAG: tRNA preQ1(34) S-adenosylmethionine ribosyltransferase-isomerase QueA [Phycisphaerales bacterium]
MLRTADLDYELPESRIATVPATPRDSARLMVIGRDGREVLQHAIVRDLPRFLRAGDVLVFNNTRVLPARLIGRREDTGGQVEGLFLGSSLVGGTEHWTVLLRAKKVREGMRFSLEAEEGQPSGVLLVAVSRDLSEGGAWLVRVEKSGAGAALEAAGHIPLPPYILKAREKQHAGIPEALDRDRYQTVYAKDPGSVAAPTAGLHFTAELLARLKEIGVERVDVTLHVGTGTFRPVETETVEDHPMHSEWCSMSIAAVGAVRGARAQGRRVIAVGTTSARTLESYASHLEAHEGREIPSYLETRLLITPGYPWRWVSGMLTNFHLPRSSLLAMVGSFLGGSLAEDSAGIADLKRLYREAIAREYRFYSYGDAMLIV